MKEMTETKGLEVKGIDVRPTQISDMQSYKKRAFMHHTIKQSTDISLMSTIKL